MAINSCSLSIKGAPPICAETADKIAKATTLKQAIQSMGFIEKIIDYFRGDVKRDTIKRLFYAIHDEHAPPTARASSFFALRDYAKTEHQGEFIIEIHQGLKGYFYYSFHIDRHYIYTSNALNATDRETVTNIVTDNNIQAMKEAFEAGSSSAILKFLSEFSKHYDKEWYRSDILDNPDYPEQHLIIRSDKEKLKEKLEESVLDARDRDAFYEEKLEKICDKLTEEEQKKIYAYMTTNGGRLRSVLDFLQGEVADIDDNKLVSLPTKFFSIFNKLAEVLSTRLTGETVQLPQDTPMLTQHTELTSDEKTTLSTIGLGEHLPYLMRS